MADTQPLNETVLAQQCLRRLSDDSSILHGVAQVLELIAHSSIGLGEVLQDYAGQSAFQLREMIGAAQNVCGGNMLPGDWDTLRNMQMILKSAKTVLDMTPSAMSRNKADVIGEKEKVTRSEVLQITDEFANAPDIIRLLASEDSGDRLVALLQGSMDSLPSPVATEGDAMQAGLRY
jgi:hypothetical protein